MDFGTKAEKFGHGPTGDLRRAAGECSMQHVPLKILENGVLRLTFTVSSAPSVLSVGAPN
jgi:hypothetical protein